MVDLALLAGGEAGERPAAVAGQEQDARLVGVGDESVGLVRAAAHGCAAFLRRRTGLLMCLCPLALSRRRRRGQCASSDCGPSYMLLTSLRDQFSAERWGKRVAPHARGARSCYSCLT